ncbi:MAG: DUF2238 domain-containing protein [Rhodocyclaceae bacterium]|nr:DUF2238 domain-containing protein [Rhodocyclaceae bacterium]
MSARPPLLLPITLALVVALAASAIAPYDRLTWLMEVLPVMLVLPALWLTARRFPLTTLLYLGILAHALVLILGGAYTYARVPLGFQLADWLDLARNPYDKIGHFFQGLVPAVAAREILIRGHYVNGARMTAFLVVCVVLAISASYELIEWWAALAMGQGADEFLGTQGDQWDTQSDMFCALLGAATTLIVLSPAHDRQIEALADGRRPGRVPQGF